MLCKKLQRLSIQERNSAKGDTTLFISNLVCDGGFALSYANATISVGNHEFNTRVDSFLQRKTLFVSWKQTHKGIDCL
jgi:hypothetical protein